MAIDPERDFEGQDNEKTEKGLGRAPSVELANTDRTPNGCQS